MTVAVPWVREAGKVSRPLKKTSAFITLETAGTSMGNSDLVGRSRELAPRLRISA